MPAGIAMLRVQAWPESARSLGMLSLMLLIALLPHVAHLPVWIPLCVTGAMVWRLWIEVHAAALPNKWLRSIMALLALMAVLINFRSLNIEGDFNPYRPRPAVRGQIGGFLQMIANRFRVLDIMMWK